MIDQCHSHNREAHSRVGRFRACRGVGLAAPKLGSAGGSARSRILFLLAGWLALVTPLRADNPPTYLIKIDSAAVPGGAFYPNYLALDSSNNVYVTDSSNNRIVKFAGNGAYLTQWGTYGTNNGELDYPGGVAVDSSNNVYVIDANNWRVKRSCSLVKAEGPRISAAGGADFCGEEFLEDSGLGGTSQKLRPGVTQCV